MLQFSLPTSQKTARVTPRLKKSGLDPAAIQNYRPISNLPFMSKVIEKLILALLFRYLAANNLFPDYQSGFRRHHSTETAIFRVLSDIYGAIDLDQVSLLALLDVSAAFDTVDHSILLERLSTSYGALRDGFHLAGVLHHWTCAGHPCWWTPVYPRHGLFWCPSRFSPRTCVLYTADIIKLVESFSLRAHLYADDTQLYGYCCLSTSAELLTKVLQAIESTRSTPGCHQIASRSTQGRRISYSLVHGLVVPNATCTNSPVNLLPWSNLPPWRISVSHLIRNSLWRITFLSAPDPENQEIRPDLNRCPTGSPLATDPSSYSIQVERHYKKMPRGSSPSILNRALSINQRDPGEAQPTIGSTSPAPGPSFP